MNIRKSIVVALAGLVCLSGCEKRDSQQAAPETLPEGVEVVEELYRKGELKVRKQVKVDEEDNQILHGLFQSWYESGQKKAEGSYVDGKAVGTHTRWYEGEKDKPQQMWDQCEWADGKKNGDFRTWHPDGELKYTGVYKDGGREGKATWWHPNGKKAREGTFKKDMQNGVFTIYYENGKKGWEVEYVDDKEHGTYTSWYEDGQKWEEKHFVNGALEGMNTKWHPNGTKDKEGSYADGKKHGAWTTWDAGGNVVEQVEYVNGERKEE